MSTKLRESKVPQLPTEVVGIIARKILERDDSPWDNVRDLVPFALANKEFHREAFGTAGTWLPVTRRLLGENNENLVSSVEDCIWVVRELRLIGTTVGPSAAKFHFKLQRSDIEPLEDVSAPRPGSSAPARKLLRTTDVICAVLRKRGNFQGHMATLEKCERIREKRQEKAREAEAQVARWRSRVSDTLRDRGLGMMATRWVREVTPDLEDPDEKVVMRAIEVYSAMEREGISTIHVEGLMKDYIQSGRRSIQYILVMAKEQQFFRKVKLFRSMHWAEETDILFDYVKAHGLDGVPESLQERAKMLCGL